MGIPPLFYSLQPDPRIWISGSYARFHGPWTLNQLPGHLPKGGIVAVRPHPSSAWEDVERGIDAAARRVTNGAFALWPDCVGRRCAAEYIAAARLMGVRAVVWNDEPHRESLRAALTDWTGWPHDVLHWLRFRGVRLPTEIAGFIETLARHAPEHRSFERLAAAQGLMERRCRSMLKAAGHATPSRWHALLRALGIALMIQREPNVGLEAMAFRFGFSAGSVLSDRLYDVIGARPSFIRGHLGVQWMLADAMRRENIL